MECEENTFVLIDDKRRTSDVAFGVFFAKEERVLCHEGPNELNIVPLFLVGWRMGSESF